MSKLLLLRMSNLSHPAVVMLGRCKQKRRVTAPFLQALSRAEFCQHRMRQRQCRALHILTRAARHSQQHRIQHRNLPANLLWQYCRLVQHSHGCSRSQSLAAVPLLYRSDRCSNALLHRK